VAANFTVRPFPQFKDAKRKSGAALYGYARMVNAKSSDAARTLMWKVHKAWSSDPKTYLDRTGLLQPTKTFVTSDDFKKVEHLNVFLEDAIGTPFNPQHNSSIEIGSALTRAMERITQEKADPKTSLDQAKKEIDDIIAKG
jgi:ABC-type glycerol-3-phosphate transport system substrate-binding protein